VATAVGWFGLGGVFPPAVSRYLAGMRGTSLLARSVHAWHPPQLGGLPGAASLDLSRDGTLLGSHGLATALARVLGPLRCCFHIACSSPEPPKAIGSFVLPPSSCRFVSLLCGLPMSLFLFFLQQIPWCCKHSDCIPVYHCSILFTEGLTLCAGFFVGPCIIAL